MRKLTSEIIQFFQKQGFVIVSTLDARDRPHSSCKGIVRINKEGQVDLFDLYRGRTYANLKRNHNLSITAVDEHGFKGYCLKGEAQIVTGNTVIGEINQAWEQRIISRIAQRILRNLHEEKGHLRQAEALLPKPKYLIRLKIEEVVDLTPGHLKER